ncbi:hypothetical protein FOA52_014627 [Chlamydomonas sp. UWO 241]|nr:hypothetical protein FOA52_014627 [Chlamydomonas sp. UWO 241]
MATFFGTDSWSIHEGGCNFGYIWTDQGLPGWDTAAVNDGFPGYLDSCGKCFEVQCEATTTSDGYGESMDRREACRDTSASVIVRVVDTCPCVYPPNAWSNRRWCCGERDHMDLSVWAFEKLADVKWGVIPIKYREVACTDTPRRKAIDPYGATPGQYAPAGTPYHPTRDWPELHSGGEQDVYRWGHVASGFVDSSKGISRSSMPGVERDEGSNAYCATVTQKSSMIRFTGWSGAFSGKIAVEAWFYVNTIGYDGSQAQVPDISIRLDGNNGACPSVRLQKAKPQLFYPTCRTCTDYWFGYRLYLPFVGGGDYPTVINDPADFSGCGDNTVWELQAITFAATWADRDVLVCLDRVRLV